MLIRQTPQALSKTKTTTPVTSHEDTLHTHDGDFQSPWSRPIIDVAQFKIPSSNYTKPVKLQTNNVLKQRKHALTPFPIRQDSIIINDTSAVDTTLLLYDGPYVGHRLATDNRKSSKKGQETNMQTGPCAQLLTSNGNWWPLDILIENGQWDAVLEYINAHLSQLANMFPFFTVISRRFVDDETKLPRHFRGVVYQLDVTMKPKKNLTHEVIFEDGDYCALNIDQYMMDYNTLNPYSKITKGEIHASIVKWRTTTNYNSTAYFDKAPTPSRQHVPTTRKQYRLTSKCLDQLCKIFSNLRISPKRQLKADGAPSKSKPQQAPSKETMQPSSLNEHMRLLFYHPTRL